MVTILSFSRRTSCRTVIMVVVMMITLITIIVGYVTPPKHYETYLDTAKSHYGSIVDYVEDSIYYWTASPDYYEDNDNLDHDLTEGEINYILAKLETPLHDVFENNRTREEEFEINKKIYNEVLSKEINEPNVDNLVYEDDNLAGRASATLFALVQDKDLNDMIRTIKQIESKFNNKYRYPYTFLNDEEFTDDFKKSIINTLPPNRIVNFGLIEGEEWAMPDHIDRQRFEETNQILEDGGVRYSKKESYHNMCRYYSKGFYKHPLLQAYKYMWRIEPGTNFYCSIDYDIFQFMSLNDKIYGFVLNLYDSAKSVASLWNHTMEFVRANPKYLNRNGAFEWLKEDMQNPENYDIAGGYSTCHFWTNFEIIDMDFLRSPAYDDYVNYLEKTDNFYYERWGDAPVRSIALGLFADKSQIHWFRDVGYYHEPYTNCPASPAENPRCDNRCQPGLFTPYEDLEIQNCQASWLRYAMSEEEIDMF